VEPQVTYRDPIPAAAASRSGAVRRCSRLRTPHADMIGTLPGQQRQGSSSHVGAHPNRSRYLALMARRSRPPIRSETRPGQVPPNGLGSRPKILKILREGKRTRRTAAACCGCEQGNLVADADALCCVCACARALFTAEMVLLLGQTQSWIHVLASGSLYS